MKKKSRSKKVSKAKPKFREGQTVWVTADDLKRGALARLTGEYLGRVIRFNPSNRTYWVQLNNTQFKTGTKCTVFESRLRGAPRARFSVAEEKRVYRKKQEAKQTTLPWLR